MAPTADLDRRLGDVLRQRRQAAGLTQRQVADWIGVTGGQISSYESGGSSIPLARLNKFAERLNLTVTELLANVEPRAPAALIDPHLQQSIADLPPPVRLALAGLVDTVNAAITGA